MFSSRFLAICGCNIFKSLSRVRCSASSAAIRGPCPEELSSWNQGHGLCVSKTLTPVHLAKCVCVHLEAQWALKMSVNYMMSTALQSFCYSYFETLNCKIHFVWKRVRRAGLPGKGRDLAGFCGVVCWDQDVYRADPNSHRSLLQKGNVEKEKFISMNSNWKIVCFDT